MVWNKSYKKYPPLLSKIISLKKTKYLKHQLLKTLKNFFLYKMFLNEEEIKTFMIIFYQWQVGEIMQYFCANKKTDIKSCPRITMDITVHGISLWEHPCSGWQAGMDRQVWTGRYGQAGKQEAGRYNTHSVDHILNILLGLFLFKLSAIKPGRRKNAGKILIHTKTILRLVDINNHILPWDSVGNSWLSPR